MRIVFFGASELGFDCCKHLVELGYQVVGICTIPSTFSIKYKADSERRNVQNVLYKDFSYFNNKFGIPVCVVETKMSDYIEIIELWKPDFILVIGWYYMIPERIMRLPIKGVAGIHASLLPKYRGNAPLVWAMINGEEETGVSLFYIEGNGVDEGDIIQQDKFKIENSDTIKEVLEKAKIASLKILTTSLPLITDEIAPRLKQNNSEATYFPKRSPEDGLIDWTWDKQRIKNFVRAQTKPYPGAFTFINDKKIIIWDGDIEIINNKD
ncbi:MAG: methionyl-tRNA formyltransferase [Bacteroidia bacterium]|nr:methionyl-tRNA formyltransferase [Bacteroidia bacterium]